MVEEVEARILVSKTRMDEWWSSEPTAMEKL